MAKGAVAQVTFIGNAKSLLNATKNINKNLGTLTSGFSKVGKFAKATFAVFAASAAITGLKGIISAGEQAIQSQRRLTAIFRNQNLAGTEAFRSLGDEARKLGIALGKETTVIQDIQGKLALFTGAMINGADGAKKFRQATELAFDFEAAGLGTALQGAEVLGKALNDPAKAAQILKKAGIILTQEQIKEINTLVAQGKIAEAQAAILRDVQGIIGGIAEKTALASDKIKIAIADIFESLGVLLLPLLDPVAKGFRVISDAIVGTVSKSGGLQSIWDNYLVPAGQSLISTLDSARKNLGFTDNVIKNVVDSVKIFTAFLVGLFNEIFRNDALNQTLVRTLQTVYQAFSAVIKVLGEVFLPILNVVAGVIGALWSVWLDGLIRTFQFVITVILNVVNAIAGLIKTVANAIDKFGEFITTNQLVQDFLQTLKDTFFNLIKSIKNIGTAIGEGFIGNILDGITSTVDNLYNKFIEIKNKIIGFFSDIFNLGQQSQFNVTVPQFTTPNISTPTFMPNGQIVLPKTTTATPAQPKTIVKELPTGTPFGQTTSKPTSNFNYTVNVQTLVPTASTGKVIVDSIKQFEARSGTALTRSTGRGD